MDEWVNKTSHFNRLVRKANQTNETEILYFGILVKRDPPLGLQVNFEAKSSQNCFQSM